MNAKGSTTTAASMASQTAERLRIELDVFKFILRLEIVTPDHLVLENRKCTLCKKPYGKRFQIQGPEMACELPCGCTVGHMCIREHWSLYEMAQVSCPVCQKQIPELVEASTALARLRPCFSRPEPSGNTSSYSPNPKITVTEEEAVTKRIEQFENHTGLHFLSQDGSLESSGFGGFSADLCDWSEDATSEGRSTANDHEEKLCKGLDSVEVESPCTSGTNGSDKSTSRRRSIFRVWGLGRAAVKAVDIFPKKRG